MIAILLRRFASMILIMLVISVALFALFESDKLAVATKVLGQFATLEQKEIWIENNGYNRPAVGRYFEWLGNFVTGNWGTSIQFNTPVTEYMGPRLANTGILGGLVLFITIGLSLVLGVLSGISEGSFRDRVISIVSVLTTSVPEFASATLLVTIFVFNFNILPGTSGFSQGFSWAELVLPVAVLVIFNFGYYTRMTRASMAEVMTSQYIRTAVLKGVPYRDVVVKHALRNGLIAPFTVMALQLNYLLSGVIVVEVFFSYNGFGRLIYEAAINNDIYMLEAATMIAVFVAVASQVISDIGYTFLNPRIRYT